MPHNQDAAPGPPLSPEEALARMTVPAGFHVELVASEPDLVNPVAMTFDERGRIWVTESLEYPRSEPGPGRDRVKVLEDTTGDGRADRVSVFAEGLNIPSGIAVGHGGVWVANAPDLLLLKDTTGDGRVDQQEVVLTGFGRTDTHELPNSLTWGPDGWLYGLNGVFNHSRIEHQGRTWTFNCALWRLDPRTRRFELFAEGTSNPWGLAWDDEGSAFVSACVIDHLWHLVESGYYHRQAGAYPPHTWKIESIVNHRHQKAAYCGLTFFDSEAYPAAYRRRLYMGNIHGGAINVDVLERHGATYRAQPADDLLQANDAWFMPVAQQTGPDGCLYVLDWYDRYHCYQDARRDPEGIDRLKGRLYRIVYGQRPTVEPFDLASHDDAQLIERLGDPNIYFRQTAQRLLAERDRPATRRVLESRVVAAGRDDSSAAASAAPHSEASHTAAPHSDALHTEASHAASLAARHALWALVSTGRLEPEFHRQLLAHPDRVVRGWGVRAAASFVDIEPGLRAQVLRMTDDPAPDVRLQVAIAAGRWGGDDALRVLLEVLAAGPAEPLVPQVIWQNLHPRLDDEASRFVELLADSRLRGATAESGVLARLVPRLVAGPAPLSQMVLPLIARCAAGDELQQQIVAHWLAALATDAQAGTLDGPRGAELRDSLLPWLVECLSAEPRRPYVDQAVILAATWQHPSACDAADALIRDQRAAGALRVAALRALISTDDARHVGAAAALLNQPPTARLAAAAPPIAARQGTPPSRTDAVDAPAQSDDTPASVDAPSPGDTPPERDSPAPPQLRPAARELQREALAALAASTHAEVATMVLASYDALDLTVRSAAVDLLASRPAWSHALLAAIDEGRLPARVLGPHQARKLVLSGDAELAEAVRRIWGTVRTERDPQREQVVQQMLALVREERGDPQAGAAVFQKACGVCHRIYGEGHDVGPDVTLNGRGSIEQLLSNVFDPNLVIGADYQARTVVTVDGRVVVGLVVEESPQRLTLKLQGGQQESFARESVEAIEVSALSMMPEGVERQLTEQELADLLAFLVLDRPPDDPQARRLPERGDTR